MASQHHNMVLDVEHERSMLEGALTFLVILLSLRLHLGNLLINTVISTVSFSSPQPPASTLFIEKEKGCGYI